MALCASGAMSLGGSTVGRSVACELGCQGEAPIDMNRADVRSLVGISSGEIGMDDFYGASDARPTLGSSFEGGFYTGTISAAGTSYYIIVAPNATGCARCQWKTTRTTTSATSSCSDGYSNTYGPMNNATHPAGNFTATRTIGGFSDWYLPARDELNQLYVNKGTTPAGEGFCTGNYWSSTERTYHVACTQFSTSGNQNNKFKTSSFRLRAVRREPI